LNSDVKRHVKASEEDLTVTDFLDEKRQEITNRLKELKPLVDEYNRLEAAASALAGVGGAAVRAAGAVATGRKRGPGRPRGSAASTTKKAAAKPGATKRRAGRRKGSGTRAAEALAFVEGQPGITIPELAAKMGIKQNYLYRVLPGLEQEKKVSKKGRGWHPKA
jgi:predicted ribonuclease toxin of YeeF-YezG toxin-antitoxin module